MNKDKYLKPLLTLSPEEAAAIMRKKKASLRIPLTGALVIEPWIRRGSPQLYVAVSIEATGKKRAGKKKP